jgi:transposase-like protein
LFREFLKANAESVSKWPKWMSAGARGESVAQEKHAADCAVLAGVTRMYGCTCGLYPRKLSYDEQLQRIAALEAQLKEARWTCFHCGVTFTDEALAREHFGAREWAKPAACQAMLNAYSETFELYGVHRNFHNAASVHLLKEQVESAAQQRITALEEAVTTLREDRRRALKLANDIAGFVKSYGLENIGPNSEWRQWIEVQRELESETNAAGMVASTPPAEDAKNPKKKLYYVMTRGSETGGLYDGCVVWWKPNCRGYTANLDMAGVYTEDDMLPGSNGPSAKTCRYVEKELVDAHCHALRVAWWGDPWKDPILPLVQMRELRNK